MGDGMFKGMKGFEVFQITHMLAEKGFFASGKTDGVFQFGSHAQH